MGTLILKSTVGPPPSVKLPSLRLSAPGAVTGSSKWSDLPSPATTSDEVVWLGWIKTTKVCSLS